MKVRDDQGNEYEFEQTDRDVTFGITGTLKPIDEWPQEGDEYWYINNYGDTNYSEYDGHLDDTDMLFGIYRTKEEAEMAAERIRSLQEAKVLNIMNNSNRPKNTDIIISVPKKYLKAWKDLSDE